MKTNTAVTRLAQWCLGAAAAAALVACGGEEETHAAKTRVQLEALDTSTCAPNASAASGGGVVPDLCNSFETNHPPISCTQLYPGSKGIGALLNNDGTVALYYDETGAAVAAPPAFLGVSFTSNLLSFATADTASIDYQVVGALIKNIEKTHIYDYATESSDAGLEPPDATRPALWYNVCYVAKPIVTGDPEWCSPGYWKNHTDAWPVPTNTLYTLSPLTVKRSGKDCASAPAYGVATLYDVVSKPQCYGGEAANLVGDYLSTKKGLNFTGQRVDNCPLN